MPAQLALPAELRLLLASAWIAPPACRPAQAARIEAAHREGISWGVFLNLIDRHGLVVPPEVLGETLGTRLPGQVSEQLRTRKAAACRRALVQTAELLRIARAFGAPGIEMLPMKGVVLSEHLYGDPAMRICRDIDLLVKPERLRQAGEVLVNQGYRCIYPDFQLTARRQQWILQHGVHFSYCCRDRSQLVELHWRLTQWPADQVAKLWGQCQMATLNDTPVRVLPDEMLLLFLCDHGAKHEWRRAKWLTDVVAMLAQERALSWEPLLALADRLRLTLSLAEAGLLAHWLFDVPIPAPLQELVDREKPSPLAARAVRALLLSDRAAFALPERLRSIISQWHRHSGESRRALLRTCLLSTDEFKEFPLPDGLFWLYFPLRPVLWFYHYYLRGKA